MGATLQKKNFEWPITLRNIIGKEGKGDIKKIWSGILVILYRRRRKERKWKLITKNVIYTTMYLHIFIYNIFIHIYISIYLHVSTSINSVSDAFLTKRSKWRSNIYCRCTLWPKEVAGRAGARGATWRTPLGRSWTQSGAGATARSSQTGTVEGRCISAVIVRGRCHSKEQSDRYSRGEVHYWSHSQGQAQQQGAVRQVQSGEGS